jgi:hypothetical protein
MLKRVLLRLQSNLKSHYDQLINLSVSKRQEDELLAMKQSFLNQTNELCASDLTRLERDQVVQMFRNWSQEIEKCLGILLQKVYTADGGETFKSYKFKEVCKMFDSMAQEL